MFQRLSPRNKFALPQTNAQEYLDSKDFDFTERILLLSALDRSNQFLGVYKNFQKYFEKIILYNANSHEFSETPLKILEVGGGNGGLAAQLIPFLQKKGYNIDYHILDIHTDVLEWAQKNLKNKGLDVSIHNGEDRHLKIFDDKSFDFVISLHVLHHIHPVKDLKDMLYDTMRITRHSFFMVDLRRGYIGFFILKVIHTLRPLNKILYEDGKKSIHRSYTPNEMRKILRSITDKSVSFNTYVKKLLMPYQLIYGYRQKGFPCK